MGFESSPHRAGDYSGIGVDIDSSGNPLNTFWAANEYTGSSSSWATWLANFSVTSATGPAGASVVSSTPNGTLNPPVSSITFAFSEAMNTSSFSLSGGVDSFTGRTGSLISQLTGFTWVDSTHLQVTFNAQQAAGAYTMVIGPNILRASDNHPMDQNGNGTAGEVPADEIALPSLPLRRPEERSGAGRARSSVTSSVARFLIGIVRDVKDGKNRV